MSTSWPVKMVGDNRHIWKIEIGEIVNLKILWLFWRLIFCIYLFISAWTPGFVALIILMLKLSQLWLVGSLSGWLFYSFICMLLSFFELSLYSGTKRCSRLTLLFLSPTPGNNHFSKEFWLLLVEVVFRNQDLHTRCSHCYWGIIPRPSQWTELRNTHTHISIYFSLYIKSHEFSLIPDTSSHWYQSNTTGLILAG